MGSIVRRIAAAAAISGIAAGMLFAAPGTGISAVEAEEIALRDAKVENVEFMYTGRDHEDGRPVYDVEFFADGREYDYEIDAQTGDIISMDSDAEYYGHHHRPVPPQAPAGLIGDKDAGRIAFEDAGIGPADAERLRIKHDRDDGRYRYEVEFAAGGSKYEYKIDASSGAILEYSVEKLPAVKPAPAGGITIEQAAAIALERVKGATMDDLHIRADRDDGRVVYEGAIWFDSYEYEFEVDALTGRITDWDRDREHDWF